MNGDVLDLLEAARRYMPTAVHDLIREARAEIARLRQQNEALVHNFQLLRAASHSADATLGANVRRLVASTNGWVSIDNNGAHFEIHVESMRHDDEGKSASAPTLDDAVKAAVAALGDK